MALSSPGRTLSDAALNLNCLNYCCFYRSSRSTPAYTPMGARQLGMLRRDKNRRFLTSSQFPRQILKRKFAGNSALVSRTRQLRRDFSKHPVKNLMRQINRLFNCHRGRNYPRVYLPLARQPHARNQTCTQVNHSSIQSRHTCIGVEHQLVLLFWCSTR